MYKNILLLSVFSVLLFSCTYNSIEDKTLNQGVIIKTGTICGWCTVNDTLTISGNSVRYVNYANCSNVSPSVSKTGTLTSEEQDALLASIQFAELEKINLNTCYVCADGCDHWISYQNGTESHYIRFGINDPEIQPIQSFIQELNTIKAKFAAQN